MVPAWKVRQTEYQFYGEWKRQGEKQAGACSENTAIQALTGKFQPDYYRWKTDVPVLYFSATATMCDRGRSLNGVEIMGTYSHFLKIIQSSSCGRYRPHRIGKPPEGQTGGRG
ncbi:MAG: hypothetical protein JXR49_07715 [Acidobacteria bacterium]|nr:hypothetical protein [Acidobacteriota bacterium]